MSELFIDIKQIPNPTQEYVAWVDVMGIKNIFKKKDKSPALYILKLHKSAQLALRNKTGFHCYPLIDGFFITHPDLLSLIDVVKIIFLKIAEEFINEPEMESKFMIRAGISHGNVIHGDAIQTQYIPFNDHTQRSLLFGKAIIDAWTAENEAPPFSIKVHTGSRKYFNDLMTVEGYVKWFHSEFDHVDFKNKLMEYYAFKDNDPHWIEYPAEKKNQHLAAFLKMLDESN